MGYLCTCARAHRASASHKRLGRLYSNLVCGFRVITQVLSTSHELGIFPQVMGGVGYLCTCARAPPSPYLRIRVANCAKIWCVARDPIVTRFTKSEVGWPHSHVRVQFRCLGNRWALALKPHQKQTYLFRARSFIAKHGVLLVNTTWM